MLKNILASMTVATGVALVAAAPASAGDSNGNFQIKAGVSGVLTQDKTTQLDVKNVGTDLQTNGHGATTENIWIPTATLTYYFNKNLAVELFCCFGGTSVLANDVTGGALFNGANTELAHATMFPPALTLQYHVDGFGPLRPYVGVGVQWIHYFNEKVGDNGLGGLGAQSVNFKDSFGFVAQGGVDYDLGNGFSLGVDVKKVWLDTEINWKDAAGNTMATAKHDLDPLIVTANIGYRFNLGDLFGRRAEPAPLK